MRKTTSLFDPVVPKEKRGKNFECIRTDEGAVSTRMMIDDVYQDFIDPDGNFAEQFQSEGFDARIFELYLFAYLQRSGFSVDRRHNKPDFLASRNGVTVAIEATTVNPAGRGGQIERHGKRISDLSGSQDFENYRDQELPIRFGSPIYTKISREEKYWDLEHCRGLPFVLAVEAFHDPEASIFAENSLAQYLYGLKSLGQWGPGGELIEDTNAVESFRVGSKTVPAGLFWTQEAENISAVLFVNSGTTGKFTRMGYHSGFGCDLIHVERLGMCYNPDADARDPTCFKYSLNNPPRVEAWGQGLVVLHNPKALVPLPIDYFPDAAQTYIKDGVYRTDHLGWHPMSSTTFRSYLGKDLMRKLSKIPLSRVAYEIGAIKKSEFHEICGPLQSDSGSAIQEEGWFSDNTFSFLGVLFRDLSDKSYGCVVFARDPYFRFRPIGKITSIESRVEAVTELYKKIVKLLDEPQRIF